MSYEKIRQAAEYVGGIIGFKPEIGIILGSGLGGIAEKIESRIEIPYKEIPHMACSTAPGHKGQLVCGSLGGKKVVCMQGRLHFYEGHPMEDIAFPIRMMKLLGIETLIVTNAAGGVNFDFNVGDIMLIEDHINFQGTNPLIGENASQFGPRFNDMTYTYTPELRKIAAAAAEELGIKLRKGVYFACTGPSYETPAEIRAFRILGADAVGMSTVPEVTIAAHAGIRVLAFSLITNMAAGVLDQKLTEEEVIEIGQRQGHVLQALILRCIENM